MLTQTKRGLGGWHWLSVMLPNGRIRSSCCTNAFLLKPIQAMGQFYPLTLHPANEVRTCQCCVLLKAEGHAGGPSHLGPQEFLLFSTLAAHSCYTLNSFSNIDYKAMGITQSLQVCCCCWKAVNWGLLGGVQILSLPAYLDSFSAFWSGWGKIEFLKVKALPFSTPLHASFFSFLCVPCTFFFHRFPSRYNRYKIGKQMSASVHVNTDHFYITRTIRQPLLLF